MGMRALTTSQLARSTESIRICAIELDALSAAVLLRQGVAVAAGQRTQRIAEQPVG